MQEIFFMHTLTILAICLVGSSVLQYAGFYLYTAFYKKRFLSSYSSIELNSDSSLSSLNKPDEKQLTFSGSTRQQKHIRKSIANLPSGKGDKTTKMHVVKASRKQLAAVARQA